jgi:hypothetical protein
MTPLQWGTGSLAGHQFRFHLAPSSTRSELSLSTEHSNPRGVPGRATYEFEVRVDPALPSSRGFQFFSQWHDKWLSPHGQECRMRCPPPASLMIVGERCVLNVTRILSDPVYDADHRVYSRPAIDTVRRDVFCARELRDWTLFRIDSHWSEQGSIDVYVNGVRTAEYAGPTIFNALGNHWKIGYYRHASILAPSYVEISNSRVM